MTIAQITNSDNLNLLSPRSLRHFNSKANNKKIKLRNVSSKMISNRVRSSSRKSLIHTPPSTPKKLKKIGKNVNLRRKRKKTHLFDNEISTLDTIQIINISSDEDNSDSYSDTEIENITLDNFILKKYDASISQALNTSFEDKFNETIILTDSSDSDFASDFENTVNSFLNDDQFEIEKIVDTLSKTDDENDNNNKKSIINQNNIIKNSLPTLKKDSELPVFTLKESIYTKAKKLFQKNSSIYTLNSNTNLALIGREHQFNQLNFFFSSNIQNLKSDFLYIYGPPGTGKTAQTLKFLNYFVNNNKIESSNGFNYSSNIHKIQINNLFRKITITNINCMTISNINKLFIKILNNFDIDFTNPKTYRKYFNSKRPMFSSPKDLLLNLFSSRNFSDHNILLLDEIDSLLNSSCNYHQSILDLFSMTNNYQSNSNKLIIIGISNDLKFLAERKNLQLLKKTSSSSVNSIKFSPYVEQEIYDIIKSLMNSLKDSDNGDNTVPLFNSFAMKLISKKCSNTGDLRRVFDICFKAIENTEILVKNSKDTNIDELTCSNAPKVSIANIGKLFNSCQSDLLKIKFRSINLQSKILLCCLLNFERIRKEQSQKVIESIANTTSNVNIMNILVDSHPDNGYHIENINSTIKDNKKLNNENGSNSTIELISVDEFYHFYKKLIKIQNLQMVSSLSKCEFIEIISNIETSGLIHLSDINRNKTMNNSFKFKNRIISSNGITTQEIVSFVDENELLFLKKILNSKI
ncbi:uncharacterized protein ASCRUDRAFT_69868 [Ascoidea rubescens DSM 1968]|uniref:Uncharacterized protein n=1 Tax=Ascoidea rubescens DSM 1968 TaxID=1344418 RepID=A0A1D2VIN5_9ASCO|nr:hypothetical protein ASCRUDRAFT_69868 [Ascoidea rubescens DSM 1968]ODV61363.1 hypothetical protein ASCRUDRAFT_69868 [Ascoidea rubescens DSM 1968]